MKQNELSINIFQKLTKTTGNVYGHRLKAYEAAAETVGVSKTSIRTWVREYETMEYVVVESRRGKHAKTASPIFDMEFREEFRAYVRQSSCEKGTQISL